MSLRDTVMRRLWARNGRQTMARCWGQDKRSALSRRLINMPALRHTWFMNGPLLPHSSTWLPPICHGSQLRAGSGHKSIRTKFLPGGFPEIKNQAYHSPLIISHFQRNCYFYLNYCRTGLMISYGQCSWILQFSIMKQCDLNVTGLSQLNRNTTGCAQCLIFCASYFHIHTYIYICVVSVHRINIILITFMRNIMRMKRRFYDEHSWVIPHFLVYTKFFKNLEI